MGEVATIDSIRRDTFLVQVEDLVGKIVTKDDFAEIDGNIEPTRDLALKLFTVTKVDHYECTLEEVRQVAGDYLFVVKATVTRQGKTATGLGAATLSEIRSKNKKNARAHHDAIAIAETRAMKRALEMIVGAPFINEIILRLFGGFQVQKQDQPQGPEMITEAQKKKIFALMRDLDIHDRETRLDTVRRIIGREVQSSKELTKEEAARVIERLEKELEWLNTPEG